MLTVLLNSLTAWLHHFLRARYTKLSISSHPYYINFSNGRQSIFSFHVSYGKHENTGFLSFQLSTIWTHLSGSCQELHKHNWYIVELLGGAAKWTVFPTVNSIYSQCSVAFNQSPCDLCFGTPVILTNRNTFSHNLAARSEFRKARWTELSFPHSSFCLSVRSSLLYWLNAAGKRFVSRDAPLPLTCPIPPTHEHTSNSRQQDIVGTPAGNIQNKAWREGVCTAALRFQSLNSKKTKNTKESENLRRRKNTLTLRTLETNWWVVYTFSSRKKRQKQACIEII